MASYTYDRESAQASEPYLRQFLEMVVKETGAKSVSIIAHSMGNQPLMDVLRDMKSAAPPGVAISQVILAAPDVDADNFTNLAQAIKGFAKGVTLYASSNDRALIVSRNFWGNYRAGDVPAAGPLMLPGIDTIDVTAASTDAFAHQPLGLRAEQQAAAGHRQADPQRLAAARPAPAEPQEGRDRQGRLLALRQWRRHQQHICSACPSAALAVCPRAPGRAAPVTPGTARLLRHP